MSIHMLNYYRVTCDGLDEKSSEPCKNYINVAARNIHDHLSEVLNANKWSMDRQGCTWCLSHKEECL